MAAVSFAVEPWDPAETEVQTQVGINVPCTCRLDCAFKEQFSPKYSAPVQRSEETVRCFAIANRGHEERVASQGGSESKAGTDGVY